MVKHSIFNRDGESSILSGPTKVSPASSSGPGSLTFNQQTGVQFSSPVPCPVRPMDQDRTLRTFRFGFESRAGYQSLRSGGRAARRLTVPEDQMGSTPIHFANNSTKHGWMDLVR